MSYTLGIPADGQSLGNSKTQVRGNFTSIFNTMAINHIAFNSIGEGKHKFLQMPEQGSAPATAANEGGLYTKEAQTITNLFWRQESSGTEVQMTNIAPTNAATGFTFLPGGMIMQWGTVTLDAGSQANVVFSPTYRLAGVNTPPWIINLTLRTATATIKNAWVSAYAYDNFDILGFGAAGRDVFWMAIGPRT